MPEFANPFSGRASDRKLTKTELIRAMRYNIAAEYEAVQLYMQLAESIDDPFAIAVLEDVSIEELRHAGEFLRVLRELSPQEEEYYAQGARETEELLEKMRTGKGPARAARERRAEENR